ncbi:MAG: transglutaminase domain-containing protein [Oscillospiraceae bacterium]
MKIKQRIISALAAVTMAFSALSTTSYAADLRFDLNGDGFVNAKDAYYVLTETMLNGNTDPKLDVNKDGFFNAKDAYYVLQVAMEIIVPEPEETEPEAPAAESILDDYTKKWAYNTLTDNQKAAYEVLVKGILKCEKQIDLLDCGITQTDYDKAFAAILADNPHVISTRGAGSMMSAGSKMSYIKYSYSLTAAQCSEIMKTVEENTAEVIAEAKTLKTDYDRIKLFHDWIINRTEYIANGELYNWRLDGPIIYAKSVCEGYSKAFSYLCQSVGIECLLVSGIGTTSLSSGPHMWNMVKVDGKWYHMDVTWDDPLTTNGKPTLRYDYFLLSEAKIKEDHTIDNTFKIPTATSNYAA